MSIAVVLIVAGRAAHLARTLDGLSRQSMDADEVVVVDMAPAGETAAVDAQSVRTISLARRRDHSLPLGAARNAGAAATQADRIVFLDVDCVPGHDLVGRYAAVLETNPAALACGPVRYLHEGWDHDFDAAVEADDELEARSAAHPARPRPSCSDVLINNSYELFWSLSFGVARTTWQRLGGFDEGYCGYGAEDTDLGLRARELGVPLVWFGGGTAYHQWHPATRLDPDRASEIVANARRFRARWGVWPMTGWLTELSALGTVRFDPRVDVLELIEQ